MYFLLENFKILLYLLFPLAVCMVLLFFRRKWFPADTRHFAIVSAPFLMAAGLIHAAGYELGIGGARQSIETLFNAIIYIAFGFGFCFDCLRQPRTVDRWIGIVFSIFFGNIFLLAFIAGFYYVLKIQSIKLPDYLWLVMLPLLNIGWMAYLRHVTERARVMATYTTRHCEFCDYDLRGSPEAISCPECGQKVTVDAPKN